ncbi:hypothetical protein ACLE1R_003343, partial [Cronobacter malonaticus]
QLLNAGVAGALRLPALPICDVKRRAGKQRAPASYNRSSTQTANKKAAPEGGFYAGVLLSFYAVLVRIR